MDTKRMYTRAELVHDIGFHAFKCVLCCNGANAASNIRHAESCPLGDTSVTAVVVVKHRASIVFRCWQSRWWWRGPSGAVYRIEKFLGCYAMFDAAGNEQVECGNLSGIKDYLITNQGAY